MFVEINSVEIWSRAFSFVCACDGGGMGGARVYAFNHPEIIPST